MDEYRIDIKVRNNLLLNAIEKAGYKNVSAFCKAADLSQTTVGAFINLKRAPLNKDGTFCTDAQKIMDFFGVLPEDLWTVDQLTMELDTNKGHLETTRAEMVSLLGRAAGMPIEYESPEVGLDNQVLQQKVEEVLDSLTPREKKVLQLRYGIGISEEMTLDEVGDRFDVTRERIRQIETKAFRKLKTENRNRPLREFL
jgi:RNA polymerase sigma factor (sigma-70 family)